MPPTTDPVRLAVEQARSRADWDRQQVHQAIAQDRDQLQRRLTYAGELADRIAVYDAWLAANAEPEPEPCAMGPYVPEPATGGVLPIGGPLLGGTPLTGDLYADNTQLAKGRY